MNCRTAKPIISAMVKLVIPIRAMKVRKTRRKLRSENRGTRNDWRTRVGKEDRRKRIVGDDLISTVGCGSTERFASGVRIDMGTICCPSSLLIVVSIRSVRRFGRPHRKRKGKRMRKRCSRDWHVDLDYIRMKTREKKVNDDLETSGIV